MFNNIHNAIIYLDHAAWYYLNTQWHNAFFDSIIPFVRNQWFWAPLYLFLLLFMPKQFGKKGWIWCGLFLLTFALSDQISASLLKPLFHRTRPCNCLDLTGVIHLIVPCGGGYSFPSSHASNHFSMGVFAAITLQKKIKGIWAIAILWAVLVAYAQVYVGVHYPLDITFGAILGIIVGNITGKLFNNKFGFI